MKRNNVETILGAFVLIVAVAFIIFFQETAELGSRANSYEVQAKFTNIDGLNRGSSVRISGVSIGKISDFNLDPESYMAIVTMQINDRFEIPYDSVAIVASESLLGGKYIDIQPGADDMMLAQGDMIEFTQSTPGIEALLGQAIYGMQDNNGSERSSGTSNSAPDASDRPMSIVPMDDSDYSNSDAEIE